MAEPMLPLDADALGQWRTRVRRAVSAAEKWTEVQDQNLKRYAPPPEDLGSGRGRYDVNTNTEFRNVESKKALLLFDVPTVILTPEEPRSVVLDPATQQPLPLAQAIAIHQAYLTQLCGPKPVGVGVKRMAQQVLTDCLAVSGLGWSKIGYTRVTQDVKVEVEDPTKPPTVGMDPMSGLPTLVPAMKTERVPVPVYEAFFWERFSYRKGLLPADWDNPDTDEAPWIGMRFAMPLPVAIREFGLPEDFDTTVDKDPYLSQPETRDPAGDRLVTGTEIWYKAALFDSQQVHPQRVRELVLIDGLDERPARHRDSPHQSWTEEGRLTPDSLIGYPIHPLALRDVPDSAFPAADASMTRPLVEELNTFRSQQILQRDASRPVVFFNESVVPPAFLERVKANDYWTFVPIPDDKWPAGSPPLIAAVLPSQARDNYTAQDYIERDIDRTLATGEAGGMTPQQGRRSATEIQTVQGHTSARMALEQGRVLEWLLRGIAKLDALAQRYAPESPTAIEILGEDGVKRWAAWDKQLIAGRNLYTAKPDSQLHLDQAQDRAQHLQFHNLTANNPYLNPSEGAKVLVQKFGYDPAKWLVQPQPPAPPLPKVSVTIQAMDFLGPAAPIMLDLVQGKPVSPESVQLMLQMKQQALAAGAPMGPPGAESEQPVGAQGPITPPETIPPIEAHQGRRTAGMEGMGVS